MTVNYSGFLESVSYPQSSRHLLAVPSVLVVFIHFLFFLAAHFWWLACDHGVEHVDELVWYTLNENNTHTHT